MSKTDKTRPGWVKKYDPTLPTRVRHDHRNGVCIEETLGQASTMGWRARWSAQRAHRYAGCPRRVTYVLYCSDTTTDDGVFHRGRPHEVSRWDRCNKDTGASVLDFHTTEDGRLYTRYRRHTCPGHTRVRWDNTISCRVCEDLTEPTCSREFVGRYSYQAIFYGGRSRGDDRNYYERSARQSARLSLREAARDWNANGDTDIEPEPARHRHGADWWAL